jgi:hypothetical protein
LNASLPGPLPVMTSATRLEGMGAGAASVEGGDEQAVMESSRAAAAGSNWGKRWGVKQARLWF